VRTVSLDQTSFRSARVTARIAEFSKPPAPPVPRRVATADPPRVRFPCHCYCCCRCRRSHRLPTRAGTTRRSPFPTGSSAGMPFGWPASGPRRTRSPPAASRMPPWTPTMLRKRRPDSRSGAWPRRVVPWRVSPFRTLVGQV